MSNACYRPAGQEHRCICNCATCGFWYAADNYESPESSEGDILTILGFNKEADHDPAE